MEDALLAAMPIGVKASFPSEDQGVRLAPSTMAPDYEIPAAAHGSELPRGVLAVRRGSGGLLAPVLRLPLGLSGMTSDGHRPPHGDFGGDILAVSRWQNILSQS